MIARPSPELSSGRLPTGSSKRSCASNPTRFTEVIPAAAYDRSMPEPLSWDAHDSPPVAEEATERLVRSRQRVADHGEVFTPAWLVEDILDLVKGESERIDSRFLEPACGSGNFLVPVLRRKLATVHEQFTKSDFEKRHHALLALMCIYGIELLSDNAAECRANLLETLFDYLGKGVTDEWFGAAKVVVDANIVQGDALGMITSTGEPMTFPEWAYLGKGKFQRRDFLYDDLSQRSSFEGTLFEMLEEQDAFAPLRTYPPMSVAEIAE